MDAEGCQRPDVAAGVRGCIWSLSRSPLGPPCRGLRRFVALCVSFTVQRGARAVPLPLSKKIGPRAFDALLVRSFQAANDHGAGHLAP
jgi:hypothetical protein